MKSFFLYLIPASIFVLLMALAEGPIRDLGLDRDLPASRETWDACCGVEECQEARIQTAWISDSWKLVKVDDLPAFPLQDDKILPSLNGKTYYCRIFPDMPLNHKNVRCVFVAGELA